MRWFGVALVLAACGDNRSPCDYAETDDTANATTAETSGVVVDGAARDLCGSVDTGHYDPATSAIDVDRFRFTTGGDGNVLVRIAADPAVDVLSRLTAKIFDTAPNPRLFADVPLQHGGDHGAQLVSLPAGDYDVVVAALASGDLSAPLSYRVQLVLDPACAQATGAAYQESTADNDAIAIELGATPAVSAMAGTAEATGLVATANNSLHISGSADGTAHGDSYADRDTYAIRTDATANELVVRLDWADPAADLDFFLFDPTTLQTIAAGDLGSPGAQEIRAFAVAPSTSYLLWIGGYAGTHAPATYDATLCGTHFFH